MRTSGSVSTTDAARRAIAALRRHSYIALLGLPACPGPAAVAPSGPFLPADEAAFLAFARRTLPAGPELVRFSWRSDDGRLQLAGSGAARLAPPDSLRVDIAASLGVGRATLILTADRTDARPEELVQQVVPDRFAFWAVLGVMRLPPGAVAVEHQEDGDRHRWRVRDRLGRLTLFDVQDGALRAVTREVDGRIASTLALRRRTDGSLEGARLTDVARQARLAITITAREASGPFPPEIWRLGL